MDSYKGDAFEMTSSGILTGSQLLVASRLNSFRCKLGVLVDSGHWVDCFFPLDGTVARTYCYDNGLLVASLRERLTDGSFWTEDQFTTTYSPCPDPSGIPADAPPAKSLTESNRLWQEAYDQSKLTDDRTITVPWITAGTFRVGGGAFDVEADISQVMSKHGEGVYSVIVWGLIDDQDTVISEYSIFHGVTPPDTYNPGGQQP